MGRRRQGYSLAEEAHDVDAVLEQPLVEVRVAIWVLGVFSYEKIPGEIFPIGIRYFLNKDSSCYFVAEPWRAIADMIYTRKKAWPCLQDLSEDMRIETDALLSGGKELLSVLADQYPNKRTQGILSRWSKEVAKR